MKSKRIFTLLMAVLMVFAFIPGLSMPAYGTSDTWSVTINEGAHMAIFSASSQQDVTKGQPMTPRSIVISRTSAEYEAGTNYKFGTGSNADFITGTADDLHGLTIEKKYDTVGPGAPQWHLVISGTPTANVNITLNDATEGTDPAPAESYNVAFTLGQHLHLKTSSGALTQNGVTGAISAIVIEADEGYALDGAAMGAAGLIGNIGNISDSLSGGYTGPAEFTISGTPKENITKTIPSAVPKPKATINTLPTAATLEYTGSEQYLLATPGLGSSQIEYSMNQQDWSFTTPTGINAGNYTVYYRSCGNASLVASDVGNLTVTITPKTITPTITVYRSYTYDGKQKTPTHENMEMAVFDNSTLIASNEYTVSYGENIAAGVGAGSVTVTDKAGGNYTWSSPVTRTFNIEKATPTISVRNTTATVKKNGTINLAEVFGPSVSVGPTPTWEYLTSDSTKISVDGAVATGAGNVGEEATITIRANMGSSNYNNPLQTVTVKVTDKEPQNGFVINYPGEKTYGDPDFPLDYTNAVGDITWSLSSSGVVTVDSTGKVSIVKPGTVTITAEAAGNDTYAQAVATCELTVNRAVITIKANDKSIKVGETIPSVGTTLPESDYTVTGLVGDDVLGPGSNITVTYFEMDGVTSATPDTSVAGTYKIAVGGENLPTGKEGGYYEVEHVMGTLTIKANSSGGSTSGGGGGGGGGAAVETPSTTTEQKPGTAEAQVTMDGGKATATVSADTVNKAIEDVNKQAATGEKELVLEVKSEAGTTAVETKIPATAVENLAKSDVNTTLQSACGNLEIPNAAMENIASQASGDLSLSMENKKSDEVVAAAGGAEKLEKATGIDSATLKNADAVEVNMTADGKAITSFGGNKISIFVPLTGNQKAGRTYMAASISADGTIESLAAKCVKIAGKLFGKLEAGHLTTFVVTDKEVNNPFTDVKESDYFYQPVLWAVDQKVTSGTSEDTFSPNAGCTRAQMVTFLWRAAGSPWASANKSFSDVPANAYYKDAIEWAIAAGITTGISETAFDPNGAVTREQLASFIYRYAKEKGQGFGDTWEYNMYFSDTSKISSWADEAMHWCVMKGVVTGTSTDTLTPQGTATRGQIVTMLYRYFGL